MTSNPLPLSVCVITLNEEDNIERCLNSVQWAEDILVVDSGSTDRTVEIAEDLGARVIRNDWPGHKEQKQNATDQAKYDWILSLDADEWLSDELTESIQLQFKENPPDPHTCFKLNRLSRYLGQWLYHGSWHPDWIVRLFNRTNTHWSGQNPHDRVLATENIENLPGKLYHIPYDNLSDHLEYINNYTDIMADEKLSEGASGSLWRAVLHGGFKCFRDLFLKAGILDGTKGIACAINGGIYTYFKYLKLWEKDSLTSIKQSTSEVAPPK